MTIDLRAAREIFEASVDGTVGLEEEFSVLDPESLALTPRYEAIREAAAADPVLDASISGELIASEVEIRSGRGEDFSEAQARQSDHRRRLFALAGELGVALGSTGTHPFSDYREQPIIDTEHYRRVEDGLRYVAWRNNTFSLHVHVGIRSADRALQVCDRLRAVLPDLLAISASSPFLDGRDSGLRSARTQTFTRSFPRCGIPDPFGSWAAFAEYVDFLVRTRSIVEYTQVWWSVRPHLAFGTVEVRICDAQVTAAESDSLAALIVACVLQAAREVDEGTPAAREASLLAPRLVEENLWRAIRWGTDGELLDLRSGEAYPAAAAAERLLRWTEPVRAELGLAAAESLPERNGARRQRDLLKAGHDLREVWAQTVRDTALTYGSDLMQAGRS